MAPFYSRYVPGSHGASAKPVDEASPSSSKKRKLDDEQTGPRQDIKKSKKIIRGKTRDAHDEVAVNGHHAKSEDGASKSGEDGSKNTSGDAGTSNGSLQAADGEKGAPTSEEQPSRKQKKERKPGRVQNEARGVDSSKTIEEVSKNDLETGRRTKSEIGKEKNKRRKKAKDLASTASEDSGDDSIKPDQHASIRSKFENAKKKTLDDAPGSEHKTEPDQEEFSPPWEIHGLEPLPQPPPAPERDERPAFSSLPPWLANPLRVDSSQSAEFSNLGLDPAVLENVDKQGLEMAFPVQSTVIPLLTDGPDRHSGDVCISAATGSGKTLAYVLPMIQHLKKLATTKLRGLIVVPTRELVRQAKETCDTSAAGTSIKIATALGSKSLHDEQQALVEKYEVYDPEEYKEQQDAPVDWSEVNLADMLSELDNEKEGVVDFVPKYRSKVDVLICTPGRLVDHIRSTKGFTLDDVLWLVIDEADRLLNESFQEWTDIVIPALQSRAAHALQDNILRDMRLEVPERIVQKVILSATMTQDISKLNALKLRNPKLVVVGDVKILTETDVLNGSALGPQLDEGGTFNLPPTLVEYAVPVGDGAEKPLYLLELLRTKVNVFNLEDSEGTSSSNVEDEEVSSSDSSASDSESTTSTSSRNSSSNPSPSRTHNPPLAPGSHTYKNTALIFTRSTESATRLHRLLTLLSTPIASLATTLTKSSSTSTSRSTRKALTNFRNHKVRVIIATDRASRGLDLPGLGHVISYDVPTSMTTYVHRVGRTARAGKEGTAWTLVAHREGRWFWGAVGKGVAEEEGRIVRRGKVKRCNLDLGVSKDDGTRERYERALKTLGEEAVGGETGSTRAK